MGKLKLVQHMKGTPADKFRKVFALSGLAVGIVIGLGIHFSNVFPEKLRISKYIPDEELRRRQYFFKKHTVTTATGSDMERRRLKIDEDMQD